MKQLPSPPAVLDVEQRLERSKRQLHEQLNQAQSTLHSTLTRPSSLLMVTGIGALLGMWIARRRKKTTKPSSASEGFPIRSLVFALLTRFILQRIEKRSHTDGEGTRPGE